MKRLMFTYILGFFINYAEGSATITVPAAGNCGDDTVLTCQVSGSIGSTSWFGLGRSLAIKGTPTKPEDINKYTETRATSSFTLTIHNTDLSDEGEYRCENGFDESRLKQLNIECKASAADISVTNGKKVSITVDKLYPSSPSSPAFSVSFKKENTDVPAEGSRTCSSSTQYSGYYRCVWSSSSSLADGSYDCSIVVTTITQANPLTGSFMIVSPQAPLVSNTVKLQYATAVFGYEGQSLTIQCTSHGEYPIPTLAWYKNSISASNQLTSTSFGTLQNDGTYTVTLSHTFTPGVNDDEKTLICTSYYPQADSAFRGSKTTTVMLYLRLAVQSFSIKGNSSQNSVTVDEHDADLQFVCIVDKYLASSIKISFNGDVLAEQLNQKSLSFKRLDVSCLDAGVYICEAKDEYGYIPSKNITLFVKCSPRPFRQSPRNFTSKLHVSLTLSFDVIAHPEPGPKGFTWFKKGGTGWRQLLGNVDLKISSSGLQSNLTLQNVSNEDYGNYKVIATNNIGIYEQQLFVFENEIKDYTSSTSYTTTSESINNIGHDDTQTENTTIIVGVALGVLCLAVVVYATVVTVLLKRKTSKKETETSNKSVTQTTYANLGFESNVSDDQNTAKTDDEKSDVVDCERQYTSLDPFTKNDNAAYEVIQTH